MQGDIATIPRHQLQQNPAVIEDPQNESDDSEDGAWGGIPDNAAINEVEENDDLENFMSIKIASLCKDVMEKLRSP